MLARPPQHVSHMTTEEIEDVVRALTAMVEIGRRALRNNREGDIHASARLCR